MMLKLLKSLLRKNDGIAAVELGLATPVFLLMFLSVTELGHMLYYSINIEKGMRSGVTYMARNNLDVITDPTELANIKTATINLTMTGTIDKTGNYLVAGYKKAEEDFLEPVTVTTKTFSKTLSGGNAATVQVIIVVLSVDVPYVPLLPFVTDNFMGTFNPSIKLTHEQALIGD